MPRRKHDKHWLAHYTAPDGAEKTLKFCALCAGEAETCAEERQTDEWTLDYVMEIEEWEASDDVWLGTLN